MDGDTPINLRSSRRKVLKAGTGALSLGGVGVLGSRGARGAALSYPKEDESSSTLENTKITGGSVTEIGETRTDQVMVSTITLKNTSTDEVTTDYQLTQIPLGDDTESVQAREISESTYQALLTNGVSALPSPEITTRSQNEGPIERWWSVYAPCGNCNPWNQTHSFRGIAVELKQKVNDSALSLLAGSIAAALTSAGVGIVVSIIGWLLGMVTTFDSVTIGRAELDTLWNTRPRHGPVIAGGFNVTQESNWIYNGKWLNSGHPF